MIELLEELRDVPNVIVDESFIHFACEGDGFAYRSVADEVQRFPNLMVVKSMSKDFGVAGHPGRLRRDGTRSGPGAAGQRLPVELVGPGRVLLRPLLPPRLPGAVRARAHPVHPQLATVLRRPGEDPRACASTRRSANFALVELQNGLSAEDLVCRLLVRRGIYTRTCDDKKGLEPGKFLRIAARNRPENSYIIRSLRRLIG